MTIEQPAFLTPETLAEYFKAGTPTVQPLSVEPACSLRIEPRSERLELYVPMVGAEPDVSTLERLELDTVEYDGAEWFRLSVDAVGIHHEAYSLLASIVDEMGEGAPFVTATSNALIGYRELLNSRQGLNREKQEGLIGELLVLSHAVGVIGPLAALDSWLGPVGEQHDFGFPTFDAEVKTTRSESRSHVVGALTQLEPSVNRPLWLVSIQLTLAGRSKDAFSLAGMVGELRTAFGEQSARFIDYLRSIGWRDVDHQLYTGKYILRAAPATYLVDEQFPAITRARIDDVVPQAELVSAVSYRVDVTALDAATPPEPLTNFVD